MKPWAVLRRVWIRLLVPSRGPLERRLWCQLRISSDQLRMVSRCCGTRESGRFRRGRRSVGERRGRLGGRRPDRGCRALVKATRRRGWAEFFRSETVVSFQESEPGAEQVRFEAGFTPGGWRRQFSAYQGSPWATIGLEAVQDVTGSGKIVNSCPVGVGTVGDYVLTPSGSLLNEKP